MGHATGLLGYWLPPSGHQTPPLSSASSPPLSIVCAWHTVTFLPFLSFHHLDHLIAPPTTGHSPFYRAHVLNTTQPNIATRMCQPQKRDKDKATPYPEQLVVTIDKMSAVRETVWHTSKIRKLVCQCIRRELKYIKEKRKQALSGCSNS